MDAKGLTPILNVSGLAKSFAWFEKLGWQKRWEWGDPPGFGAVAVTVAVTVADVPADAIRQIEEGGGER